MLECMRTSIDLDEALLGRLKREAARRGISVRELINELLRRGLTRHKQQTRYRLKWKPFRGGQIQPGVRLDDRECLFDLMDGRRASRTSTSRRR